MHNFLLKLCSKLSLKHNCEQHYVLSKLFLSDIIVFTNKDSKSYFPKPLGNCNNGIQKSIFDKPLIIFTLFNVTSILYDDNDAKAYGITKQKIVKHEEKESDTSDTKFLLNYFYTYLEMITVMMEGLYELKNTSKSIKFRDAFKMWDKSLSITEQFHIKIAQHPLFNKLSNFTKRLNDLIRPHIKESIRELGEYIISWKNHFNKTKCLICNKGPTLNNQLERMECNHYCHPICFK